MAAALQLLLDLRPEQRGTNNNVDDKNISSSIGDGGGGNVLADMADTTTIPRRGADQLTYNEFYWDFMKRNWPVIITGTSTDWECRRNWIVSENDPRSMKTPNDDDEEENANNSNVAKLTAINFDYLKQRVSDCRVPIADCSTKYFNSHAKSEMNFHCFLEHWQRQQQQRQCEKILDQDHNVLLSSNKNHAVDNDNERVLVGEQLLYLKDWHLQAQMPDYEFYRVPKYFASDWLNEKLLLQQQDDYRFVYMGPRGTWTPFHADVFGSFSWSANIAGQKLWLMLPPGEEMKLTDRFKNLPFRIDERMLIERKVRYFRVQQQENESLFVPSGWYHQVTNETDTISINHNWFNACNIERVWLNLSQTMRQVIAEIADCRQMENFDEHCQTMLRVSFGMNYVDFLELLEFIVQQRLNAVTTSSSSSSFELSVFHIHYDLFSVRLLVEALLKDEVIASNQSTLFQRCVQLLKATHQSSAAE